MLEFPICQKFPHTGNSDTSGIPICQNLNRSGILLHHNSDMLEYQCQNPNKSEILICQNSNIP